MDILVDINPMYPKDWEEVRQIYLEGIKTGNATFQQKHHLGTLGIRVMYHTADLLHAQMGEFWGGPL